LRSHATITAKGGRLKAHLKVVIPFIGGVYLLICLAVNFWQGHVIFRSNDIYFAPPGNLAVEEVTLHTPDGQNLFAWWLHCESAEKTILFFQGNGRNICYQGDRLKTFRSLDVNALLVDYRGYGKSTGRIRRERDIYVDGTAAWNFLVNKKRIPPEKIIIWGRSLGGAVAAETALQSGAAALVLESTFYSMADMARRKYWYLPVRLLLKFNFATGDKLERMQLPVIIVHSSEDGYIPFSQATRLFAAANDPKFLITTRGSHLDSFERNRNDLACLKAQLDL
jgi:fermentation-respiration switch protein FrsA (DUF1100 family)